MFSNNDWAINVKTVGQMIDELSRLPRDMKVRESFEDSVDLVVFNRDDPKTCHLAVDEGGMWDESVKTRFDEEE